MLPSLLLALSLQTSASEPPVLHPGDAVDGTIEETDPVIRTETLDALTEGVVHGEVFLVARAEPGSFHVEVRSHLFDAYLIVRDEDGAPLLEDDDGLFATHSRIVVPADAPDRIRVEVCALPGGSGSFRLRVVPGEPKELSRQERLDRSIEGTRETAEVRARVLGPEHPNTASSLHKLAGLLEDRTDYDEALVVYERALEIRETALGPNHPRTADTLNNLGHLCDAQGAYEDARRHHERALRIREAALGPEHPKTAQSLNNLGLEYKALGDYERARPLLERALRIRESVLGSEHRDVAVSLNNLAFLLKAQGHYADAQPLFERSIQVLEATVGPDHSWTASGLSNLADLLHKMGASQEARPLQERALAITEAALGPEHPETGLRLNNLGVLLADLGVYEEARPVLERALRIKEAALGLEHPSTIQSLNSLASLLQDHDLSEEARPLLERALRTTEATLGPRHHQTAVYLNNLGHLQVKQRAYDVALPLLERALRIWETTLGPDHPTTALSRNNLAALFQAQHRFDEARPLLEQALRTREETLGPDHPDTAKNLNDLSRLLASQGAYDEARPHLERSLRIREAALGPEHPHTIRSLNRLAMLEFNLGETDKALARSEAALDRRATYADRVLWSLSETERLRSIAAQEWHLRVLLSLTAATGTAASRRTGYEEVLRWKGQVARSLVRDELRTLHALPDEGRSLVERLRGVQTRLSDALYAKDIADQEAHARTLRELRAERNVLEVDLSRLRGNTRAEDVQSRVDALRAALPADAVAIDFFVHRWYEPATWEGGEVTLEGTFGAMHLSAWVTRGDRPLARFDLGEAAVVEAATKVFLEEMIQRRGMAVPQGADASPTTENNDHLRALLWDPLTEAVGDAQTVFLSADSFLGTLPLETLQRTDGSYLIEHHAFTYLADMQNLGGALATSAPRRPTLLAAGGIDYRRRADVDEVADLEEPEETGETRGPLSRRWRPLEGTGGEVSAIADLHLEATDEEGEQRILKEREATEERIKAALTRYNHVHLATHGYFHPEGVPSAWKKLREEDEDGRDLRETEREIVGALPGLLSGLVFAGANAKPEADRDNGLLTAEEITYLDLSGCDLVVLSACETGIGRAESGEGMIGLRRAFRMAGARTVVSSLWEVSDIATRELMTLFYENLWLEGRPKQTALRDAQRTLLRFNRERHGHALPSTWGAFVLDGAPK